MKKLLIKCFIILLAFSLPVLGVDAKSKVKMRADVDTEFSVKNTELPEYISFKTTTSNIVPDVVTIPENSLITLKVIRAQRELRWHKSGLILGKLVSFTPETTEIPVDVSDKDLYLTVKKYEPLDKKEAWIVGTELVIMQGASFFAPGADIGYFFIKGAIQRKKHPHWFKAGVRNAYDNSIFWFPQKGKPIELGDGDQVQIKEVKTKKVDKLVQKIDKRNARFDRQAAKRIAKKDAKAIKNELKNEKKLVDCSTVEDVIENVVVDRSVLAEIVNKEAKEAPVGFKQEEVTEIINQNSIDDEKQVK